MKNLLIVATSTLFVLTVIAVPLPSASSDDVKIVQIPLEGNKVSFCSHTSISYLLFCSIFYFSPFSILLLLLVLSFLVISLFNISLLIYFQTNKITFSAFSVQHDMYESSFVIFIMPWLVPRDLRLLQNIVDEIRSTMCMMIILHTKYVWLFILMRKNDA